MSQAIDIKCENCEKLLAKKEDNIFRIVTSHDKVNVAFPAGTVICGKCDAIYILTPWSVTKG